MRITEQEGWQRAMQSCLEMVKAKNHDYDASWRRMRKYGISDVIANKIDRVRNLENLALEGREAQVSEGIESDMQDILNYAVFYLIKIWEEEQEPIQLHIDPDKLSLSGRVNHPHTKPNYE